MNGQGFRRYAWGVLLYNLGVIAWGAYVRATGSGAGCGQHWPTCQGELIPRSPGAATLIEYTHRASSGVALVSVVALLVWALRALDRGHPARRGAAWSVAFMVTEALLGAGLVLLGLVDKNDSISRAVAMSLHLVNTFSLLAALTLTAWWASGGGPLRLRGQGAIGWILGAGLAAMLVLGVSGAVTALGDTLFPAASLAAGLRQDFSPTAHLLLRLRALHPLLALGTGSYLAFAAGMAVLLRPTPAVRAAGYRLGAIFLFQLGLGFANLFLLAPVWLQLAHLLVADLVWIALILLTGAALAEGSAGPSFAGPLRAGEARPDPAH